MYETENYIPEQRRSELNALMNQRLADALDLQMQMKQAHWMSKAPTSSVCMNCSTKLTRLWKLMLI